MNTEGFTRRQFLTALVATATVGALATTAQATVVEPFDYEVTTRDVFLRNLPPAFDGFRLTHVTDLHHGKLVPLEEVRRVVEIAQATQPDMFALTGDYTTDNNNKFLEPCAEALSALKAPHGVWSVLGNHDQQGTASRTIKTLERHGFNLLNNANTRIEQAGETLQLAGINDSSWARTDWARARRGLDFSQPVVLLSHQPQVFDYAEAHEYSLILAGHTHGGQVSFPIIGAPVRFIEQFKYVRGLYRKDATQLFVSRGTGLIGLPVRLGARPEIAVLRLRRAVRMEQ